MSNFFDKYAQIVGQDKVNEIVLEGKIIGQIKRRRKEIKMTQDDLAKLISVPKSTIGRIEAGLTSPRTETLLKISRALNIALIIDGRESHKNFSEDALESENNSIKYSMEVGETNAVNVTFSKNPLDEYITPPKMQSFQYELSVPPRQEFGSSETMLGVAS